MNRIQFNIIIVLIGLLFVSSVFAVEIIELDNQQEFQRLRSYCGR